ncbi:hypothetical protein J6590_030997 [Homalodisca vitripennis]|nr:hypothetical protein J6590_030997 [Homalodisca vitripennis]
MEDNKIHRRNQGLPRITGLPGIRLHELASDRNTWKASSAPCSSQEGEGYATLVGLFQIVLIQIWSGAVMVAIL